MKHKNLRFHTIKFFIQNSHLIRLIQQNKNFAEFRTKTPCSQISYFHNHRSKSNWQTDQANVDDSMTIKATKKGRNSKDAVK